MSRLNTIRKRMRMRPGALAFILIASSALASADVVAIVSAKNPSVGLTRSELGDIFLGQLNHFPNGTPATPLDLPEGSPQRAEFYTKFLGKSVAQMRAFWAKIIFTGRGQPPKQVADDLAMRKRVSENAGSVGYIDSRFVDDSVRVLQ